MSISSKEEFEKRLYFAYVDEVDAYIYKILNQCI